MTARGFGAVLLAQAVILGALVLVLSSGGDDRRPDAKSTAVAAAATRTADARGGRFAAPRALAEIRAQVAFGERPAGSAASRRLAERLRPKLPGGRFEAVPGGLRNIVGTLPGRRPAIVIGAHYDTDDIPAFVGANDGAAGTAVLLEVARSLRRDRPAGGPELRFVLFDGEEEPKGSQDFRRDALRGSKAYVRAHRDEVRALVLLDYVGNRGLSIPREAGSDPALWARLRAAARRVGAGGVFPPLSGPEILDDHTPFTEAGIPAIDLIDFSYRYRDLPSDTVDKLDVASLDAVGESVVELIRSWPRGAASRQDVAPRRAAPVP